MSEVPKEVVPREPRIFWTEKLFSLLSSRPRRISEVRTAVAAVGVDGLRTRPARAFGRGFGFVALRTGALSDTSPIPEPSPFDAISATITARTLPAAAGISSRN
jgi:hypothetical protein